MLELYRQEHNNSIFALIVGEGFLCGHAGFSLVKTISDKIIDMIRIKLCGLLISQVDFEFLAGRPSLGLAGFGESMGAVVVLLAIQFKHAAASELFNSNVQAGNGNLLFFIAFKAKSWLGFDDCVFKLFNDPDLKMMQAAVAGFQMNLVFWRFFSSKISFQIEFIGQRIFNVQFVDGTFEVQKPLGTIRTQSDAFFGKWHIQ